VKKSDNNNNLDLQGEDYHSIWNVEYLSVPRIWNDDLEERKYRRNEEKLKYKEKKFNKKKKIDFSKENKDKLEKKSKKDENKRSFIKNK
jgi:hypothetical protein